jgi:hypothetical protein
MMLFIRTHGNLLIKASTKLNPKTALTTMLEYPLPVQSLLSLRKPSLSSALLSRIGKNYHCQVRRRMRDTCQTLFFFSIDTKMLGVMIWY